MRSLFIPALTPLSLRKLFQSHRDRHCSRSDKYCLRSKREGLGGEGRDKQISHDNIRLEGYLVLNNAVATRFFTPPPRPSPGPHAKCGRILHGYPPAADFALQGRRMSNCQRALKPKTARRGLPHQTTRTNRRPPRGGGLGWGQQARRKATKENQPTPSTDYKHHQRPGQ